MNNTIEYKGYVGSVEFSEADNVLHGKVLGVNSLISYEGTTVKELLDDFRESIDDYFALCQEKGVEPEKPYKGSFNVRISPELHKRCAIYAMSHNKTLNNFVKESLELALLKG